MKTVTLILIILFQIKSSASPAYLLVKQDDPLDKLKEVPNNFFPNVINSPSLKKHLSESLTNYQKLEKDYLTKPQLLKIELAASTIVENANEKCSQCHKEITVNRNPLSTDVEGLDNRIHQKNLVPF